MNVRLAAGAVLAAIFTVSGALAQPAEPARISSPRELVEWIRALVLERVPQARIEYESTALLRFRPPDGDSLEIRTERVWHQCEIAPDDCVVAARRFVEAVLAADAEQAAPIRREQLRVVVRPDAYARDVRNSFAKAPRERQPILERIAPDLWLVLVADLPTSLRLMAADDLRRLQLSRDDAIELAKRNVAATLAPLKTKAMRHASGFFVLQGDDFESSRPLLDAAWQELAAQWKGALAIMIPGSQTVLFAQSSDRQAMVAMEREAATMHRTAERGITTALFHWTRAGWIPYRLRTVPRADTTQSKPRVNYLQAVFEAAAAIREDYVDEVDMASLLGRCDPRLSAWLLTTLESVPKEVRVLTRPLNAKDVGYESDEALQAPVQACIGAMAASLDARTEFLHGEALRDAIFADPLRPSVGITLDYAKPYPQVIGVRRPGPAAASGVLAGDYVITIDGSPVEGLASWEIQHRLRGEHGTSVSLRLRRGAKDIHLVVPREVVGPGRALVQRTTGGHLHVKVPSLERDMALRVIDLLAEEVAADPRAGVILDLRGNPGGLLDEAFTLAAAFLQPKDLITRIEGRSALSRRVVTVDTARTQLSRPADIQARSQSLKGLRLVVVVDEFTAAGAELIASALQGNKRAKIVGGVTRGVGTIAIMVPLGNFSSGFMLKLTTSRWRAPDGRVIEGTGVLPDLRLPAGEHGEGVLMHAERLLAG
jgi:carboxyl-terminal processing protease